MPEASTLQGFVECTNDEYHSAPGISKSMLDAISVSPLNFWDQYINPDREPREYKHCFAVGSGTHALVLEPEEFQKTYAVGFDRSAHPDALATVDDLKKALNEHGVSIGRAGKQELTRILLEVDPGAKILSELERQHNERIAGKTPIAARDFKDMMAMLAAIGRHHTAAGLLRGAYTEHSFWWTDPMGVLRKCRTDAVTANGRVVVDLKTTDDVSEFGFGRTIAQRRYHVQAAWYLDILYGLYGDDAPDAWCFIAAQKTRPYDVAVHYLTEEQIQLGRMLYQNDLNRYIDCMDAGVWPGSDGGQIIRAALPRWAMQQEV